MYDVPSCEKGIIVDSIQTRMNKDPNVIFLNNPKNI